MELYEKLLELCDAQGWVVGLDWNAEGWHLDISNGTGLLVRGVGKTIPVAATSAARGLHHAKLIG